MKKNKMMLGLIVLMILIQLVIPIVQIVERENTKQNGQEIKLEIGQYDPYDIFRGRYLNIRVENDSIEKSKSENVMTEDDYYNYYGYLTFEKDKNGFDVPKYVYNNKPQENYLEVKLYKRYDDKTIGIDYPFDRFYLNEDYSQKAEDEIRKLDEAQKVYLTIRIKNGKSVITGLYIDEVNIYEFLDKK